MCRGEAGERGVQRKGTRVACHGPMTSPEGKKPSGCWRWAIDGRGSVAALLKLAKRMTEDAKHSQAGLQQQSCKHKAAPPPNPVL